LLLVVALTACGRTTGTTSGPSAAGVYAGRVGLNDFKSAIDPEGWVEGPPTFGVRPLNSSSLPEEERFELTLRYQKLGTQEAIHINYQVWQTTSVASALMSFEKSNLGTSLTGPKAGDQVLYYNQNAQSGPAPYLSLALVRVGQTVIQIAWARVNSFVDTKSLGAVAVTTANHLKSSLAGKLHPSPSPAVDPLLLAPKGPDLTLLGSTVLPLEVVPQILYSPAPEIMSTFLHSAGANTAVYGDYALNTDTRMEVRTVGMTFTNPSDVPKWIGTFFPAGGMQAGVYLNYEPDTEQYVAAFGTGNRAFLSVCKSSAAGEAASRSCEGSWVRVVNAWRVALDTGGS